MFFRITVNYFRIGHRGLGGFEDVVIAYATPSTAQFTSNGDQFECGPSVRAGEGPRHLQDAGRALH